MSKWTPGEFGMRLVDESGYFEEEYEIFPLHGGLKPEFGEWAPIAERVKTDNENHPERAKYNAKLFAAAPRMVEALRECVDQIQRDTELLYGDEAGRAMEPIALTKARALLAEIEGEG